MVVTRSGKKFGKVSQVTNKKCAAAKKKKVAKFAKPSKKEKSIDDDKKPAKFTFGALGMIVDDDKKPSPKKKSFSSLVVNVDDDDDVEYEEVQDMLENINTSEEPDDDQPQDPWTCKKCNIVNGWHEPRCTQCFQLPVAQETLPWTGPIPIMCPKCRLFNLDGDGVCGGKPSGNCKTPQEQEEARQAALQAMMQSS